MCTARPTARRLMNQAPHHPPPHHSPNRTCAGVQCPWVNDYDVLSAIKHLLAALTPRRHSHQRAPDPQEPDHHVHPCPMSLDDTEVKQVTTLPQHSAPKGSLYDPIYATIVYYVSFPC